MTPPDQKKSISKKPRKGRKKAGIYAAVAVLLVAAFAASSLYGALKDGGHGGAQDAGLDSFRSENALWEAGEIASDAMAEIEAIASGSAEAMAQAGQEAESEFNASSQQSEQVVAEVITEAEAEIEAAGQAAAGLESVPEDFDGNVTTSPDDVQVEDYEGPAFEFDSEHKTPDSPDDWNGSGSSASVRAELGIPQTGVGGIDAAGTALIELYVDIKGDTRATANESDDSGLVWSDDTFGTTTADGEGYSHSAAPDEEGAQQAYAHANATLSAAQSVLGDALSGVQANIEVQSQLYAEVYAEVNETMQQQAEAEAAIFAEAEARAQASFAAAAEAEAEAHAEAERQVSVVEDARLAARQKVRAEAEQQVEAVLSSAAETSQELEQQAQGALESGEEAKAQIRASAQAALRALAEISSTTGANTSGQAEAIMSAAAAAEAAADAKAKATYEVLMRQSSAVKAVAELKVSAILSAALQAEAAIDAKAEASVAMTLRAEAYAVAKVRAKAEAEAEAHYRVAAAAAFRVRAEAHTHARAVINAALGLNAHARIAFDGSKDMAEMVGVETDTEVTKDVTFIREVAADYERQEQLDRDHREEYWTEVADDLDVEKETALVTAYEIITEVEYGYQVLLETQKDLEALGQTFA